MNLKYIVLRDGIRVGEEMHSSEFEAMKELNYWKELLKRWPDGSKMTIKKIGG